MDWRQYFHTGARQVIGMFLIVFALAGAWLYREELRVLEMSRTSVQIVTSGVSASLTSLTSPSAEIVLQITPLPTVTVNNTIKLSTATQGELETLPGIGPAKAKAILDYRESEGFKTVDDLEKVKGIGPKTLEKLRPFVEL
ncbi:MAG TPA: helix-hairpin-helix domain-containing protein [Patescibacteria group bacterium]